MIKQKFVGISSDDWYPTYPNNEVHVSFMRLSNMQYRCCVWGADDYGLVYDSLDKEQVESRFHRIKAMNDIKQKALKELGFVNA